MKVRRNWLDRAALAGIAVALAWPGAAVAQRRDREDKVRLREVESHLADAMRMARGALSRAQIGVSIEDDGGGVRVVGLREDGPAEKAGLREDDILTALNGTSLTSPIADEDGDDDWGPSDRLVHLMADVEPGDVVRVAYTRDGKSASVDIETTERGVFAFSGDAGMGTWRTFAPGGALRFKMLGSGFMGAELADVNEGLGSYFGVDEGALVLDVDDEGNDLGLRPGDVIVEIGGRDVRDASDAYRILGSYEKGERLRLVVMRERGRVTLEGTTD